MQTFVTSDTHLCHDRDDIWIPRGFTTADDHTEAMIARWNAVVMPEDEVYHLGDMFMTNLNRGLEAVRELHGHIHLIRGNHDSENKVKHLLQLSNIEDAHLWAEMLKRGKHYFYLSHFKTIMGNHHEDIPRVINLHGHTHSPDRFEAIEFGCYNVSVDAHNGYPVLLDNIRDEYKAEFARRQLGHCKV